MGVKANRPIPIAAARPTSPIIATRSVEACSVNCFMIDILGGKRIIFIMNKRDHFVLF
jgi:hypothetical protein